LRNGDVQTGHLRERFDTILIADSSQRALWMASPRARFPASMPAVWGAAPPPCDFVRDGGTLITFNAGAVRDRSVICR
jgi:hypothetical protein